MLLLFVVGSSGNGIDGPCMQLCEECRRLNNSLAQFVAPRLPKASCTYSRMLRRCAMLGDTGTWG